MVKILKPVDVRALKDAELANYNRAYKVAFDEAWRKYHSAPNSPLAKHHLNAIGNLIQNLSILLSEVASRAGDE